MHKLFNRLLSSLLVILTIVSLLSLETLKSYATGGQYIGSGSGNVVAA